MSQYEGIQVRSEGHVTLIELARPPYNFFDRQLIGEIADAFDVADNDDNCRALVLAAQGKAFCAGADFGGSDSDGDDGFSEEGFNSGVAELYREAARLFGNRKPIVGAIQGAAVGGGLGLALVPDFRVISPAARFSANFVKLGIHQGFGLSVTLPRLVGEQNASMMLLTGRRVGAEEALALGLADVLCDADDLLDRAMSLAAEIATNAPLAVESVRATLRGDLAEQVIEATAHELSEQQWLRATDDAAEGILSVGERRAGNFQRR